MRRTRSITPTTLDHLHLDPQNANRGTDRGRAALATSLQAHGAGRSVLIDRRGCVIAGNKTVEQARALGLPIQVVRTDGQVLVVVQREDLDLTRDAAARALAVRDNRVAELDLAWDPTVLRELAASGADLGDLWTPDEWAALLADTGTDAGPENAVLAPMATTITRGDLFALGPHRLLCGDATDAADVTRLLGDHRPGLMACDPPYGVQYQPDWRHTAFPGQRHAVGTVLNDDQAAWPAAFQQFPGDVIYAWHAGVRSADAAQALAQAGFGIRAQIIWVKPHYALSRGHYHHGHEPCFYAVRTGRSAHWRGGRAQSTVWEVPSVAARGGTEDDVRTAHATQKPVRLFEIPIRHHTQVGDAVYDPFVGSGTTVIAAEKTQRVALVMDLDPRYVQTTLTRWEQYTHQTAQALPSRGRR